MKKFFSVMIFIYIIVISGVCFADVASSSLYYPIVNEMNLWVLLLIFLLVFIILVVSIIQLKKLKEEEEENK